MKTRFRIYPRSSCHDCSGQGFTWVTVERGDGVTFRAVKRCTCWHRVEVGRKKKTLPGIDQKSIGAGE